MSTDREKIISVVILSKDEPELSKTLKILKTQMSQNDAECIVVDASEGRLDWIRKENDWVKWIQYTKPLHLNITIPQQRNIGVRESKGDIIAFCDAGGVPTDSWLNKLCEPIILGKYDVTCGPVVSIRDSVYQKINDIEDGEVVESVLTANLAFTRNAFNTVNGFDERYEYGSDADFAWRLIDAGKEPRSVRDAVMGMDWGVWSLQKKRSWRYGKARARLFAIHKKRRKKILLKSPEILVYPAWALGILFGITTTVVSGIYIPLAVNSIIGIILVLRNIKTKKPIQVMTGHIIYSWSFIIELFKTPLRKIWGESPTVLHMPKDHGPYQPYLMKELEIQEVSTGFIPEPTNSKTVNLILLPLTAIIAKIKGVKIIHIHWLHDFSLSWAKDSKIALSLIQIWFRLWLWVCKKINIKLVWTAHNTLPHRPIFKDDVKARVLLMRNAKAVIAHSAAGNKSLLDNFNYPATDIIPQGSTPPTLKLRKEESRERLLLPKDKFIASIVGKIENYKGVVEFLENLLDCPQKDLADITIYISGECVDNNIKIAIEELTQIGNSKGFDIRTNIKYLSDEEFWNSISASDIVLFPYKSITNSGALVAALSGGRSTIVSDLPAFKEIQCAAVEVSSDKDFISKIVNASRKTKDEVLYKERKAISWSNENSWSKVALETRKVYERVLKEKNGKN